MAWTVIKLWTPDTNTTPHPALPPAPDPPILQGQGTGHIICSSPRSPLVDILKIVNTQMKQRFTAYGWIYGCMVYGKFKVQIVQCTL